MRVLRTPTQTRQALGYVLHNGAKHGMGSWGAGWTDPRSSAAYLPGWAWTVGHVHGDGMRGLVAVVEPTT